MLVLLTSLALAAEPDRVPSKSIDWAYRPMPAYPMEARALGLEEEVCAVDLDVASTGMVQTLDASGCHEVYLPSVEKLRHWRAQPRRVDGTPVAFKTQVRVRFVSHGQPVETVRAYNDITWAQQPWPTAKGTAPTTCRAHVLFQADGEVDSVYVTGCDDAWSERAADGVRSWKADPWSEPYRAIVPVRFSSI